MVPPTTRAVSSTGGFTLGPFVRFADRTMCILRFSSLLPFWRLALLPAFPRLDSIRLVLLSSPSMEGKKEPLEGKKEPLVVCTAILVGAFVGVCRYRVGLVARSFAQPRSFACTVAWRRASPSSPISRLGKTFRRRPEAPCSGRAEQCKGSPRKI